MSTREPPNAASSSEILENAGEGILFVDGGGLITYANASAARYLGRSVDKLVGRDHHALFHHTGSDGAPIPESECAILSAFSEGKPRSVTGEPFWHRHDGAFLVDCVAAPAGNGVVVTFHEQRVESENGNVEILRAIVSSLGDMPIVLMDRDTSILSILSEPEDADRYGLERNAVLGVKAIDMLEGDARENTLRAVREVYDTGQSQTLIVSADLPGGKYTYETHYSAVLRQDRSTQSVLSLAFDVTDRMRAEQRIRMLAFYDELTGLPNRSLFLEQLDRSLELARNKGRRAGLLFLDLDHFKRVNDTLGHGAGDRLLTEVASRLTASVRLSDTVARAEGADAISISRLGGDEFTILLTEISESADAARVAKRVLSALDQAVDLDSREIFPNASIGIAIFPDDADDAETLLRNADTAMYSAKNQGRNRYHFYADSMNATASRNLHLDGRLRGALERGEFELHYQPLRHALTSQVTAAEALLRWNAPETGPVSPAEFIPIAEEIGAIVPIGEWILRTACQQWTTWIAAGYSVGRLAVNVSNIQLRHGDLVARVARVLGETGLPADQLELEITESTILHEDEKTIQALNQLDDMGVGLVLDDFGTGYSSLSYLRRFPIRRIKIDRSFVSGIDDNREDAAITSAILAMAHRLRLAVVAEGVETEGQAHFLRRNGCDELQGFLFSPAVPAAEFERFLDLEKD